MLLEQDDIVYVPLNPLAAVGVAMQNLLMPMTPVFNAGFGGAGDRGLLTGAGKLFGSESIPRRCARGPFCRAGGGDLLDGDGGEGHFGDAFSSGRRGWWFRISRGCRGFRHRSRPWSVRCKPSTVFVDSTTLHL